MSWVGNGLEPRSTRLILATNKKTGDQVVNQSIRRMRRLRLPIWGPDNKGKMRWLRDTDNLLRDWFFTRAHVRSYCNKRFFVRNLPQDKNESLPNIISKLGLALGVNLRPYDLVYAARLPVLSERHKPILVKVESKDTKKLLMKRKKIRISNRTLLDRGLGSCYVDDCAPGLAVNLIIKECGASSIVCADLIDNEREGDFTDNDTDSSSGTDGEMDGIDVRLLGKGRKGRSRRAPQSRYQGIASNTVKETAVTRTKYSSADLPPPRPFPPPSPQQLSQTESSGKHFLGCFHFPFIHRRP